MSAQVPMPAQLVKRQVALRSMACRSSLTRLLSMVDLNSRSSPLLDTQDLGLNIFNLRTRGIPLSSLSSKPSNSPPMGTKLLPRAIRHLKLALLQESVALRRAWAA
jgi:hypothetical protein